MHPLLLAHFWEYPAVVTISAFVDRHTLLIQGLLIALLLPLVPRAWNEWSNRFERRHIRSLWFVVALMFLAIPIVFCLLYPFH
jgi:hypothetical protein